MSPDKFAPYRLLSGGAQSPRLHRRLDVYMSTWLLLHSSVSLLDMNISVYFSTAPTKRVHQCFLCLAYALDRCMYILESLISQLKLTIYKQNEMHESMKINPPALRSPTSSCIPVSESSLLLPASTPPRHALFACYSTIFLQLTHVEQT